MTNPSAAWWPFSYNRRAASVRLRCFAIVDELRRLGRRADVYSPGGSVPRVLILSKRYDEETRTHAQALRERHGTRIVFDICDNHFYNPRGLAEWTARAAQLRATIAVSDLVIASTEALAAVIPSECPNGPPIRVIGDATEREHTPAFQASLSRLLAEFRLGQLRTWLTSDAIRLVWFGNHGSEYAPGGMGDLTAVKDVVERFAKARSITLTVVSNSREQYNQVLGSWDVRKTYLPWNEATISRALRLHDIAIIPITPNPFTLCKSNNRVATALLHGLAVVGDAIPSYQPFSSVAVFDNWYEGLELFASDPAKRRAAASNGQCLLREHWSPASICQQWIDVIDLVGADAAPA